MKKTINRSEFFALEDAKKAVIDIINRQGLNISATEVFRDFCLGGGQYIDFATYEFERDEWRDDIKHSLYVIDDAFDRYKAEWDIDLPQDRKYLIEDVTAEITDLLDNCVSAFAYKLPAIKINTPIYDFKPILECIDELTFRELCDIMYFEYNQMYNDGSTLEELIEQVENSVEKVG